VGRNAPKLHVCRGSKYVWFSDRASKLSYMEGEAFSVLCSSTNPYVFLSSDLSSYYIILCQLRIYMEKADTVGRMAVSMNAMNVSGTGLR